MSKSEIQSLFIESIRNQLPAAISLADVLAELLDISTHSAYRRIRGEKLFSFEEIQLLCNHFHISVDQALSLQTNATAFTGRFVDAPNFTLDQYLQDMVEQLRHINNLPEKELIYFCKDVPLFQYFMFPELAAFKFFIWKKTLLSDDMENGQMDSMKNIMSTMLGYCRQLADLYVQLPGIEILSPGSTATTQWQIEYAREARLLQSDKEAEQLYDRLNEMNDHMEQQAESGKKMLPGQPGKGASYKLYVNDFVIGDNTVLVRSNASSFCFINHNVINYFFTRDKRFVDYTGKFLDNVIRKSILVSTVGEKERSIFFNHTRRQIDQSRQQLKKAAAMEKK